MSAGGEKRKAEEALAPVDGACEAAVAEEHPEKQARTDVLPTPPEAPKELEVDAPDDKRASITARVAIDTHDTTLNLIPSLEARILIPLTDGGLQYLVAAARANVGVQAGRYMYEVKILESHTPPEGVAGRNRTPMPRQFLRLGFSTAGSSLFLGENEHSVCFDSEGNFTAEGKKTPGVVSIFAGGQAIGVVLNQDANSPNAFTVSLFINGVRATKPQSLPEALRGKALFPHVTFKNVTVQMHYGPSPLHALPFKCRAWQSAAAKDAVVTTPVTQKGKFQIVFPIGLPDEGTFLWVDEFMKKHPHFVELSERKILEWGQKSGLWSSHLTSWRSSNDKPDANWGIPMMDDLSVQRIVTAIASAQPRNYLVMEVKGNLTQQDRDRKSVV